MMESKISTTQDTPGLLESLGDKSQKLGNIVTFLIAAIALIGVYLTWHDGMTASTYRAESSNNDQVKLASEVKEIRQELRSFAETSNSNQLKVLNSQNEIEKIITRHDADLDWIKDALRQKAK